MRITAAPISGFSWKPTRFRTACRSGCIIWETRSTRPPSPPPALDGSRESGFGIYLITKSVDDVRYSRDERGRNCIALVKMLEAL